MDNIDLSRRNFIKKTGQLAFVGATAFGIESVLYGCATFDPNKDWSQVPPEDFNMKAFDRWYSRNKLYNKVNPNLNRIHRYGYYSTFEGAVFCPYGSTPGTDYSVRSGEVMVAVAQGVVMGSGDLGKLGTGRLGGMMSKVGHPKGVDGYWNPYMSYYCHLDKVYVRTGQKVKRGDVIGNVTTHTKHAKLMLHEGAHLAWVDPDNYGPNNSYMEYSNGPLDIDEENEKNPKLMRNRFNRQLELMLQFDMLRINNDKHPLSDLRHRTGSKACSWSLVEDFRYLETLYDVKPDLFPSLSNDEFQSMKKDFYANQPIILTLPLVKGGMKK